MSRYEYIVRKDPTQYGYLECPTTQLETKWLNKMAEDDWDLVGVSLVSVGGGYSGEKYFYFRRLKEDVSYRENNR